MIASAATWCAITACGTQNHDMGFGAFIVGMLILGAIVIWAKMFA